MTKTIVTDWRSIVLQADPDWTRDSRRTVFYEFDARGPGDERTHVGNARVFYGFEDKQGPYSD